MKVYCISGLGADHRVYDALELPYEKVHIQWEKPLAHEALQQYAQRLSKQIDSSQKFILIGVSFGGLIAQEIASFLKPQHTFIISSVASEKDIPLLFRWLAKTKILKWLPSFCFQMPYFFASFLFGTKHILLKAILKDTDPAFVKWAVQALLSWKNTSSVKEFVMINGDRDRLLKPKQSDHWIVDAGHFMIVDQANFVEDIIKRYMIS